MSSYSEIFSSTWGVILVLLFFGGSIFVHELGHFLAARLRKLKVLRFSIGFGPRIFSKKGKDGCEYIISLLPLGGYVAIPQLADMGSLEGGKKDEDCAPQNLPKASCADKIIVSVAGAFFNILFAIALASIVWIVGVRQSASYNSTIVGYVPEKILNIDGSALPSPAKNAGIVAGDKIISIDGRSVKDFMQIIEYVAIGAGRTDDGKPMANLEIERDGKAQNVAVYPVLVKTNLSTGDEIRMIGIAPAMQMIVGKVVENSPAMLGGIKEGDKVVSIDSKKLFSNQELADYLNTLESGKSVKVEVERDGKNIFLNVSPKKIALTKSLCEIILPNEKEVSLSFFVSNEKNQREERGIVKILSARNVEGLSAGDSIYQVNGKSISTLSELNTLVNTSPKNASVKLSVIEANGSLKDVYISANSTSKLSPPKTQTMLGYMLSMATVVSHPSIYEQFEESILRTYNALSSLINPKSDIGINSLAGPVDIGRVIYKLSLSDFILVISFAVLLNVNLAFLNLLPIPVLDGGHIMFALIEKIIRRPIPVSVFATIQGMFSILFVSLMLYIVYYGFMRWEGDTRHEGAENISAEFYIKDISFKNHE